MPQSFLNMALVRCKLLEAACVMLLLSLAACRSTTRESPAPPPAKDAGAQAPQTAKSIDEIRTWPQGIAKQFVLYDLGTGYLSAPEGIHVNDTWVYWTQGTRLFRAPKDGSGTPELFGNYPGSNLGEHIVTDADYVYWIAHAKLLRRSKAGGDVETISLSGDYQDGAIATGGGFVYLARWGCRTITRLDAKSLESETISLEVDQPLASTTKLVVDGDALYCGSWGAVYAMPSWRSQPVRLVDSATRIDGLVVHEGNAYWLDNRNPRDSVIGSIPLAGGESQLFSITSMIASTWLTLDRSGSRLFYIMGSWLIAFSIPERRYSYFAKDWFVRQIAIDDKYIYWPYREPFGGDDKPEHGKIMRLPLDHTPVLTVDPASITP